MAIETVGTTKKDDVVTGRDSWELQEYKDMYNRKAENGMDIFSVKPWDVAIGSVLVFRSDDVLSEIGKEIPLKWNPKMKEQLGTDFEYIVTQEEMTKIEENRNCIGIYDRKGEGETHKRWYLSLAMFDFKEGSIRNSERKDEEEVVEPPVYSIKVDEYDEDIIQEMKKAVDFKRFHKLIAIASSYSSKKFFPKKAVAEKMLDDWARAKYEYYLLFGKKLKITQEIELPMTNREMGGLVKDLATRFPKYGAYLTRIDNEYYISNSLGYLPSILEDYGSQFYSRGMKVSKFFTNFLKDKEFDIALSEVLQNKMIKGQIHISIDPYDYLTSSINKHGWNSCHRIADSSSGGEYGNGSVSYMLDDATLVAYRANDIEHEYNFFGFDFEGNSKSFRQLIYFDKASASMIFSRQYPNASNDLGKLIRGMLEDQVAEYLGVESKWKVFNSHQGNYTAGSGLPYHDVKHGFDYKFAKLTDSKDDVFDITVGKEIMCPKCGEKEVMRGGILLCGHCCDYDEDEEDDEFFDDED